MDFELTNDQKQLQQLARKLTQKEFKETAFRWDRNEEFPEENHKRLSELGFMGMSLPAEYGGGGRGLVDTYLVVEEIAKVDMSTALIVHDQNVSARVIALHGTEEQKRKYIPKFVSGEADCTIAMTEPNAGSAVTEMTTSAIRDGDEYVINGHKIFTSFADVAKMHLLYARFGPSKGAKGIGTLIVESDRPGIRVHLLEGKMGTRGVSEAEVFFENVRVPAEKVVTLGDPNTTEGFVKPLTVYNGTRVGMGILALGVAEGAFEMTREYMLQRKQFGQHLYEMQGLQWMMADMAIQIEAAKLLCYKALHSIDIGKPDPYLSSVAKVFATEMAQRVTYECQQLFGGYGYFDSLPLERMVRDVRMLTITGGTTQVLKNSIASDIFDIRRRKKEKKTQQNKEDLVQKGEMTMTVEVVKEGPIAKVILNRPEKLNALSMEMKEKIGDVFEELNLDRDVRVVIFTGEGRAFCAGSDVGTMGNEDLISGRARLKHAHRSILNLVNIEKPVIAAVRGACVGIGYSMALASDMIIASETAKFSQVFKNIGLVPDGGAIYFLTQYLGIAKAKELVYTAKMVSAQEALEIGLVTKVVPDDQLMDEAMKLAEELANSATFALGMAKKMFQSMYWPSLETLLETETLVQTQMMMSHDHKEGVQAFLEKRKPHFLGK